MKELLKLQRALYPPDGPILIYGKRHQPTFIEDPDIIARLLTLFGDELKVYHYGEVDDEGTMVLDPEPQEDPGW